MCCVLDEVIDTVRFGVAVCCVLGEGIGAVGSMKLSAFVRNDEVVSY